MFHKIRRYCIFYFLSLQNSAHVRLFLCLSLPYPKNFLSLEIKGRYKKFYLQCEIHNMYDTTNRYTFVQEVGQKNPIPTHC